MRPSSPVAVTCSSKSQCSSMPVSSTTRRSCISPQRPRTAGAFSALTRLPVASRSFSCVADSPTSCWRSSPYAVPRSALHRPDLRVELLQRRAHRRHHAFERLLLRLLAGVDVHRRLGAHRAQALAGQGQEVLLAGPQRLGRQRLERVARCVRAASSSARWSSTLRRQRLGARRRGRRPGCRPRAAAACIAVRRPHRRQQPRERPTPEHPDHECGEAHGQQIHGAAYYPPVQDCARYQRSAPGPACFQFILKEIDGRTAGVRQE